MSAASSSITYLAIVDGEPQWQAPLYDLDAVTQAVYTRLNLFQGEWWPSLTDGLPAWQLILAQPGSPDALLQMELIISAMITGTPFVTGIQDITVTFNKSTRQFLFTAAYNTQFGQVTISNYPVPIGQGQ